MKPSVDLHEIKKRLPRLKPSELETVRATIDVLLGAPKPVASEKDWLLEGLLAELRRRGLWTRYAMPRELLPSAYPAKAVAVREHLLHGCRGPLKYVEQLALAQAAAAALASWMIKCKIPVTPNTLLANLHNVPLALEESFPGYWASKMLDSCIAQQL